MAGRLSALEAETLHVVVDMQRLFAEATDWRVPGFADILPPILELVRAHPLHSLYTRFVTPVTAEAVTGDWQRFYARWPSVLLDRMDRAMLDLVEPLDRLAPPEAVLDKTVYSAFASAAFVAALQRRDARTLVLTGVETDVCVLATALDAVDRGLHVVIATDAVASWSPAGHRAALEAIYPRFDRQVELAAMGEIMAAWPGD
ncbi:MAG: cysteine hydrolase family protein [Dongiaceae bacterium]